MNKKILVTYATRSGSTTGVAEAIGRTLAEGGAAVDVLPVNQVKDLGAYDAVVVGSPVQGGQWLPEAVQFVRANRQALARKPFAAFLVCITLTMSGAEKYRPAVSGWLDPVRAMVRPVSSGLFAGMLDTRKLSFSPSSLAMRFMLATGLWKRGDQRNWQEINAWARSLLPLLG